MKKYLITIFISFILADKNCPVDQLYITSNYDGLVERRLSARQFAQDYFIHNRNILSIPVVFHNVHRIIDGMSDRSFCDYISGSGVNGTYTGDNNQDICYQRALHAYEILNEQFSESGIEFYPHPNFPLMLEITADGFDHITTSNFSSIKEQYNIPGALNIYLDFCIGSSNQECGSVSGMSTYPWSLDSNEPGIVVKHFSFPGMNDMGIAILPHELGHYFSLLHINGIWMFNEEFPRELVSGEECGYRGDLICDTPGQPGYGGGESFFTEIYEGERICVYQGFGGVYNPETDNLQIGGLNNDIQLGNYVYSNTDDVSDFWGTRNISLSCFTEIQEEYSTNCHIDNFPYLPIASNFQQPVIISQYCGRRGYNEYDPGEGYTPEQFANIRYSSETDYTGCKNPLADNYSTNFLIHSNGCIFEGFSACDVNLDGAINIADIVFTVNYIIYLQEFSDLQINIADINNDTEVNIADIVMTVNIILAQSY